MKGDVEEIAYRLITQKPWMLSKAKLSSFLQDELKVEADELINLANAARRRELLELPERKPVWIDCLDEPRVIETKKGPWEVLDVVDLESGEEHIVSLGHTVLQKKIREKLPVAGKRLVLMSLGKPRGKRYVDYVVMTEEEYRKAREQTKRE